MHRRPHPFWRYSLATYRDPAVAAACLALQDHWNADVNLLLYCGWLGQGGRLVSKRHLRMAMAKVQPLQTEIIGPLRGARRTLKHPPAGVPKAWARQLKDRISATELDLEYVEQGLLLAIAKRLPPSKRRAIPQAAVGANLSRYLDLLDVPPAHADRRIAMRLLAA